MAKGTASAEGVDARRSVRVVSRLQRNLLGYDVFISYAHADGLAYAVALELTLERNDISCFRDVGELPAGETLTPKITRALRRSSTLVILMTPAAARSRWVHDEARIFGDKRPLIAVDLGGLASADWLGRDERVWVKETAEAHAGGEPSPSVVARVVHSITFFRRNRIGRSLLVAVVVILSALSIALGFATVRAVRSALDAESARKVAVENEAEARAAEARAVENAEEARRAALISSLQSEAATVRAEIDAAPIQALRRALEAMARNRESGLAWRTETLVAAHLAVDGARELARRERPTNLDARGFHAIRDLAVDRRRGRIAVATDAGVFIVDDRFAALRPALGDSPETESALAVAWSSRGRLAAGGRRYPDITEAAGDENSGWVRWLDAELGEPAVAAVAVVDEPVTALAFDGEALVTGSRAGTLGRWSVDGVKVLDARRPGAAINGLVAGRLGIFGATGNDRALADQPLTLRGGRSGVLFRRDRASLGGEQAWSAHLGGVDCVRADGWGGALVSCGRGGHLAVWEVEGSFSGPSTRVRAHAEGVTAAAWHPRYSLVATGGRAGGLRVWFADGAPATRPFGRHDGPVFGLAWLDDATLVSGGVDGELRTWDLSDVAGERVEGAMDGAVVLTGGTWVSASVDGAEIVIQQRGDAVWSRIPTANDPSAVMALAVDAVAERALVATVAGSALHAEAAALASPQLVQGRDVVVVERSSGVVKRLDVEAPVRAAAFGRDGHVAVGFGYGSTAASVRESLAGNASIDPTPELLAKVGMTAAQFEAARGVWRSAAEQIIGGFAVYDAEGQRLAYHEVASGAQVSIVAANPGVGPAFASDWGPNEVQLWTREGSALGEPIAVGDEDGDGARVVTALAFAPDGGRLAIAIGPLLPAGAARGAVPEKRGAAAVAELCFVEEEGAAPRCVLTPHASPIRHIAYSPDGTRLHTGERHASDVFGGAPRVMTWDAGGAALSEPSARHRGRLFDLSEDADGMLVTVGGFDSIVMRSRPVGEGALVEAMRRRLVDADRRRRVDELLDAVGAADGLDATLAALQEVIDAGGQRGTLRAARGELLREAGALEAAEREYTDAIAAAPYSWVYPAERSRVRSELEDWSGACVDRRRALELHDAGWHVDTVLYGPREPDDLAFGRWAREASKGVLREGLSVCLCGQSKWEEARRELELAAALDDRAVRRRAWLDEFADAEALCQRLLANHRETVARSRRADLENE